ncbi:MAG: hypothetical protein JO328_13310 [Hyphomicrobiales bacterium]|nr:hypothetical protein [Hyphomicrobiales bacterium]MBV8824333.1 hypothetical protein [Hyphomicrobiales bacterium]
MALNAPDLFPRLLSARTTAQVEAIMIDLPIISPKQYQWISADERSGPWQPGKLHWVPVGRDRGNGGRIKLAGEPMNPLAERLVNGMESLIELARLRELLKNSTALMPASPREAVLRYFGFPKLDSLERLDDDERKQKRALVDTVRKNLSITLDFDKKSKQFAVSIRDHGMGQAPGNMHKTLLSLGRTDKADKPYLIGVFGQGGSSAFSIAKYSVVVSRRAADIRKPEESGGAGWTIVREIQPKGRRDPYFAYLAATEEGGVPHVEATHADKAGFMHGAHFCHIAYDFGSSDSAISRSMYQSLNHVLFNPVMPYELFALKDTPEPMLGTAHRLARRVRMLGRGVALDKSFAARPVI